MILQFQVGNFLSFKDIKTLSMVGSKPIKEHEGDDNFANTFDDPTGKIKLLKSVVLYGANGSGKSNLISAFGFFKNFIRTSSNDRQGSDPINVHPFLLSSSTDNEPSFFELIFFIGNIRYRYGFEVSSERVNSEWLFSISNDSVQKETKLFTRELQDISYNKQHFKEGKGVDTNTRENALFLSTAAQLNGSISTEILNWFDDNIKVLSGLEDDKYAGFTIEKLRKDTNFKAQFVEFFKAIKIGFEDVEIIEEDKLLENLLISNLPSEVPEAMQEIFNDLRTLQNKMKGLQRTKVETKSVTINFSHRKYDVNNNFLKFIDIDFGLESKGTQKLFNLFGLWIDAIENGKILIVDELDSRLHTLLTIELIKFFHFKNSKKPQLIFSSQDTNLLRGSLFRRDQIWFTEKDDFGATDLYSLVEYKNNNYSVRNDATYEKDYLLGKYGAIPFLGNIHKFTNDFIHE